MAAGDHGPKLGRRSGGRSFVVILAGGLGNGTARTGSAGFEILMERCLGRGESRIC